MKTSFEAYQHLQETYESLNGKPFRSVAVFPGLVKFHAAPRGLASPPPVPPGLRSPITEFSRRSRWNLIQRLCSCQELFQGRHIIFATLTLAGSSVSFQSLRIYFRAFCARVRVHVKRGKVPLEWGTFFWKIEAGSKTGRLHLHLIFPLADRVSYEWLVSCWGAGYVWLQRVRPRNVSAYLAKYISKPSDVPVPVDQGDAVPVPVDQGEPVSGSGAGSLDYDANCEQAVCQSGPLGRFWGIVGRRFLSFRCRCLIYIRDLYQDFEENRLAFSAFLKKFSRGYVRSWDFRGAFLLDPRRFDDFLQEISGFTCGFST